MYLLRMNFATSQLALAFNINFNQFIAFFSDTGLRVFNLISTRHFKRPVLREATFIGDSLVVQSDFDLQGNPIESIALDYEHYVSIRDCDARGRHCETTGALSSVMDVLAAMTNFTVVSSIDPDGHWGAFFGIEASLQNKTGERLGPGILGRVSEGHSDLSLGPWQQSWERRELVDFVPALSMPIVLAYIPQRAEVLICAYKLLMQRVTSENPIKYIFLLSGKAH